MWALWTQRLRRPSDEFWQLSPREIFACCDVHNEDNTPPDQKQRQQFERKGREFDAMARMLADRAKQKRRNK